MPKSSELLDYLPHHSHTRRSPLNNSVCLLPYLTVTLSSTRRLLCPRGHTERHACRAGARLCVGIFELKHIAVLGCVGGHLLNLYPLPKIKAVFGVFLCSLQKCRLLHQVGFAPALCQDRALVTTSQKRENLLHSFLLQER